MSLTQDHYDFKGPIESVPFDGLLFDMDGTIIDSTPAIIKYWELSVYSILDRDMALTESVWVTSSGWITTKSSRMRMEDVCRMEGRVPREFGHDAVEIPGARNLLASLDAENVPWAIVTSGTRPLIDGWLDVMKLARPKRMVTAEDVGHGKPDPECYQLGKRRLALSSSAESNILVFEDAPAGIKAGLAAGCKVIGLATSHSIESVVSAGAHWVVRDLESVQFDKDVSTAELRMKISNSLIVVPTDTDH